MNELGGIECMVVLGWFGLAVNCEVRSRSGLEFEPLGKVLSTFWFYTLPG
jgi:hypothetical protein